MEKPTNSQLYLLAYSNGSVRVYEGCKGSETYGPGKGYKDPPVPRRLASQSTLSGNLLAAYSNPFGSVPRFGLGIEHGQVGTDSTTSFQLCRLPFRPISRTCETHTGEMVSLKPENLYPKREQYLLRQFMALIWLLTATEKQVQLGRLHMRPLQ